MRRAAWLIVPAVAGALCGTSPQRRAGAPAGADPVAGTVSAGTGAVRGTVAVAGRMRHDGAVVALEAPGLEYAPSAEPVEIDQEGYRFVPRVTVVVPGTTVRFLNNDPAPHNVYSPEGRYNLGTWPPGESREHTFETAGIYTQLCNIHPDMTAYVVVVETPHFAVTDAAGRFEVPRVPPGEYTLRAWHEKKEGLEREVTVEAGKDLDLDLVLE